MGLLTCDNPQGCKIQKIKRPNLAISSFKKDQKSSKGQITTMASPDLSQFFFR